MKRAFFAFIFFLFSFLACTYPSKIPQPQGWVNDFANVIDQDYRYKITDIIDELESKTSAEIFVVTVDSVAPYDEREYARLIFDSWRPGKKGKDNGVLVLLAVSQRRWRIETGYGLEGMLTDGLCGEIGRNFMVPYFRQGLYGQGLYSGVSQIASVIAKEYGVELGRLETIPLKNESKTASPEGILFLSLFGLIFFSLWNIPRPIYLGLPYTVLFGLLFLKVSRIAGLLVLVGYLNAMLFRYFAWRLSPKLNQTPLWRLFVFGLPGLNSGRNSHYGYGGFGGGGFGGSFGGGFGGGGGGGGGGAGGGF